MFSTAIVTYCTFYILSGRLIHSNTSCFICHGHRSAHISGQNCSYKTWANSVAFFLEGSQIIPMCPLWYVIIAVQSFQNHGENHDRQRKSFKPANSCFYTPSPCCVPQRIAEQFKKCSALLVLHSYLSALINKCALWFWNSSLRAFVQIAFYSPAEEVLLRQRSLLGWSQYCVTLRQSYARKNNEELQLLHKKKKVWSCIVMYWSRTDL